VHFGERKSRVDAAVGPSEVKRLDRYNGRWLFYVRAGIYVGYYAHRGSKYVFAIGTHSPRYETRSGICVGSTLRQLRKRIKVTCNLASDGTCQTVPANHNHPFTVFHIDGKRVAEVDVFPGGD